MGGLQLFARYAYPPNELGYCGPADHRALLDYRSQGVSDPGLEQLARGFEGPWPYLTLLAGAAGTSDRFDPRVVEAYWVGNELLDRVGTTDFGNVLRDRFRGRAGSGWGFLEEAIPEGAVCHHSFHVFGVYPWAGLLRSGRVEQPLEVLDRCRIRWGKVVAVERDEVIVESRHLQWDGTTLSLGAPQRERATWARDGHGLVADLQAGEWVSLHWHWVCDRLTARQLGHLERYTRRHLTITNHRVRHPGPAAALS